MSMTQKFVKKLHF